MGVRGIARTLRLPPDMVATWHRQCPDFPEPRTPAAGGELLWDQVEVERWARAWGWRGEPQADADLDLPLAVHQG